MGAQSSKDAEASEDREQPQIPVPDEHISRENSTIGDKEAAFEMAFMLNQMLLKNWAAQDETGVAALKARADNSAFPYEFQPQPLPLDQDGFVQSVSVDDPAAIRDFFDRYGLVVVRAALSPAECSSSVDELWGFLERQCSGLSRDDADTWEKWPSLSKLGILGNTFLLSPQFCRNRQAPNVHSAFAALFGTPELIVNVSRASAMRPTVDVPTWVRAEDGSESTQLVERPEWRSKAGPDWLHWDMNPFTGGSSSFSWKLKHPPANRGYDALRVQGILALSDCAEDDGGFFCVPASHTLVRGWAHANDAIPDSAVMGAESAMQIYLPKEDPLKRHAQKAPIRAGDLLIWDSRLAHCNFPNQSARMRMVQYIQMIQADDPVFGPLFENEQLLPPSADFQLSNLGRKLYGFEPWQ